MVASAAAGGDSTTVSSSKRPSRGERGVSWLSVAHIGRRIGAPPQTPNSGSRSVHSFRCVQGIRGLPAMAVSKPAIALKADAYTVLFLHCCRYPTRSLNGLLLGSAAADGSVSVEMTLPLFHTQISLAPMLEAALLLADEYCQQNGLQIVGYYQANELVDDLDLGPFGKRISDKIRSQVPAAAVFVVDGASMHPSATDLRLITQGADGKRGAAPFIEGDAEGCIVRLERCIANSLQHEIIDFDAHLDDPEKNWLGNAALLVQ